MNADTMDSIRDRRTDEPRFWYQAGIAKVLVGFVALSVLVFGGLLGARIWRVESSERALEEIHAQYAWSHESPTRRLTRRNHEESLPKKVQTQLVAWLGNSMASDIAEIRIQSGTPSDEQLAFLPRLSQLNSLELRSHRATDATLEEISQLPNLRFLSVAGNRFSVLGLLQLRALRSLEELRFDSTQFSAIEVATLKAELPAVRVEPIAVDSVPDRMIFEVDGLST